MNKNTRKESPTEQQDPKSRIKEMVLEKCKGTDWIWERHIRLVVKNSAQLAKRVGADPEVVEIAAWLHDIAKLLGSYEMHNISGAKEARKILESMGYDDGFIRKVEHCILTHTTDESYPPETLEAKVIYNADNIAHFFSFFAMAQFAIKKKGTIDAAEEMLRQKYAKIWSKLMPEAQEIAQQRYAAIKLLIGEPS